MIERILTSSLLILVIILLRRLLRGRISPQLQYALWLLVALRLLVPGSFFPSPVGIAGIADEGRTAIADQSPSGRPRSEEAPNAAGTILGLPAEGVTAQPTPPDLAITHTPAVIPGGGSVRQVNWLDIIWKGGMALTAAALLVSNLRFYCQLRRKRQPVDPSQLPIPCRGPVYLVAGLASPCLFGLIRPGIYLNEAAMAPERLRHVLVHEEIHRRHGDHLWALLRGACLAIHWYNPLVWWAAILCRRDCELSCDQSAIRRLGESERLLYGTTLVDMIAQRPSPAVLLSAATTMTVGKRTMKERLELIVKKPRTLVAALVLLLLVLTAVVAVTFGGREKRESPQNNKLPAVTTLGSETEQPVDPALPTLEGRREGVYTFLLMGADPVTGLADTITLATYDMPGGTIKCMSIPRDTAIDTAPRPAKLGDYYFTDGGPDGLRDRVAELTGILPDYTVVLHAQAIEKLVDALGGVEMEVPLDISYEAPAQKLKLHLREGVQTLSGEEAMALLRFRWSSGGIHFDDYTRIEVHHDFLNALVRKCLDIDNPDTLLTAVQTADAYLSVHRNPVDLPDLTLGNLLWFVQQTMELKPENISFFTMPCVQRGVETVPYCFAVPELLADAVDQHLNPYTSPITEADLHLVRQAEDGTLFFTDQLTIDLGTATVEDTAETPPEPIEPPPESEPPQEEPVPEPEAPSPFTYGELYNSAARGWYPAISSYGSPEGLTATARDDWSLEGIQAAIHAALASNLAGTRLEEELAGVRITYSFRYPEELAAGMVLEVPYTAYYTSNFTITAPDSGEENHLAGSSSTLTAYVTLAGEGLYVPPDQQFLEGQALRDQLEACVQLAEQEVPAGTEFDVSLAIQAAVIANLEAAGLAEMYQITYCSVAGPWTETVALGPGVTQTVSCSIDLTPLEQESDLEMMPFDFDFTFTTV